MGHGKANDLAGPRGLQRSPQRWRDHCSGPSLDQGNTLLLIGFESVRRVSHPRQINGRLLTGELPQEAEHIGLTLAFRPHQSIRQHPTAGIGVDALEFNEIRGGEQGLLKKRLTGGPLQEGLGLHRQRCQEHLADQIEKLAAAG